MKRKEILRLTQAGYDLDFLARIQPQGNLKRHARYLEMGDGYVTCLRVYKYPAHGLMPFWGVPLTNNDGNHGRDQSGYGRPDGNSEAAVTICNGTKNSSFRQS